MTHNKLIHHGDCRTVLPTLPIASIQSCVTHPPYWQAHGKDELGGERTREDYLTHLVDALHGVHRVLKLGGDLWLLTDSREVVPALVADGWNLTHTVPYGLEWLLHFGPTTPVFRPLTNLPPDNEMAVFDYYTTRMPSAMVSRCLDTSTSPGDTVLDPFCGIGATGRVALRTGRHFIGIELDEIMYAAAMMYIK